MRLLILSSSKRQIEKPTGRIPAMQRYRGLAFAVIGKLIEQRKLPKDLEILIVTAKFGLVQPEERIPYADQPMDFEKAEELRASFLDKVRERFSKVRYSEIFVNLGTVYEKSIRGFERFTDAKIIYASGTLGKRVKQMKQWIIEAR